MDMDMDMSMKMKIKIYFQNGHALMKLVSPYPTPPHCYS